MLSPIGSIIIIMLIFSLFSNCFDLSLYESLFMLKHITTYYVSSVVVSAKICVLECGFSGLHTILDCAPYDFYTFLNSKIILAIFDVRIILNLTLVPLFLFFSSSPVAN